MCIIYSLCDFDKIWAEKNNCGQLFALPCLLHKAEEPWFGKTGLNPIHFHLSAANKTLKKPITKDNRDDVGIVFHIHQMNIRVLDRIAS